MLPQLTRPEEGAAGKLNAMSDPGMPQPPSSVEAKVAAELALSLEQTLIDSVFELAPSPDLAFLLELYITQVLAQDCPEWDTESLDAIFATRTQKIGDETAEISGMSILIMDQTVTPFSIRLTLTSSRDRVASYRVLLGERGGGALNISGPPCNSGKASKMLENVSARLHAIRWAYSVTSEAG